MIPYVDLVLMDCKSTDPEVHKRVTGVSNEKIRKNAAKIVKIANQVIIRVPTIPTVNAFEEEIPPDSRICEIPWGGYGACAAVPHAGRK